MDEYLACIEACQACIVECAICLYAMSAEASDNDCPTCCYECIAICELTVKVLAAGSPNTGKIAGLCADLCDWCAQECSVHDHDHCIRCAASCRKCADQCRAISAIAS